MSYLKNLLSILKNLLSIAFAIVKGVLLAWLILNYGALLLIPVAQWLYPVHI